MNPVSSRDAAERGVSAVESETLLAFLADPASYPHRPGDVRVVQTHISCAAIAGPYVYKVKKPVNFGFVDYSTLERRRHFAHREVELNRRLSPDVYLGVIPIVRTDGRLRFDEQAGVGEAVEFAVKMRKLDERFFLQQLLAAKRVEPAEMDRIVATLVPFYQAQETCDEIARHGSIENVRHVVIGNLDDVAGFVGGPILPGTTYEALRRFGEGFLLAEGGLLRSRVERGWIRDCHGDLRPEHIHLAPDGVSVYDCIEFNDAFRYIDVAADVAFLAMELDFAGRPDLSRHFVQSVARGCQDDDMVRLMRFYQCYRAAVRGKVGALTAASPSIGAQERETVQRQARDYYRLALSYAVAGLGPMVLAVMGRIATGKSTLADALSEALGWPVFSSDRIRKELAGLEPTQRTPPDFRRKLYTPAMSERTYAALMQRAEQQLRAGRSVILDATFGHPRYRENLATRMKNFGAAYSLIELTSSDDVIRGRLSERETQPQAVSDARLEDFDPLGRRYQPPRELSADRLLVLDGTRPIDELLRRVYRRFVDVGRG